MSDIGGLLKLNRKSQVPSVCHFIDLKCVTGSQTVTTPEASRLNQSLEVSLCVWACHCVSLALLDRDEDPGVLCAEDVISPGSEGRDSQSGRAKALANKHDHSAFSIAIKRATLAIDANVVLHVTSRFVCSVSAKVKVTFSAVHVDSERSTSHLIRVCSDQDAPYVCLAL